MHTIDILDQLAQELYGTDYRSLETHKQWTVYSAWKNTLPESQPAREHYKLTETERIWIESQRK
jgi:hypothetical protein